MKKTLLITGGTGFLGSNLLRKLLPEYQVILLKRSFSDLSRIKDLLDKVISYDIDKISLESVFSEHKINIVLHCATNYGRKKLDPVEIIKANLSLPLELLSLSIKNRLDAFINTDTILDKRINEYTLSKSQFKEWLKLYRAKLRCVNVALEHFYGPGDDDSKFVSFIIRNLLDETSQIDLTKGEQKRDFIYIDDAVDAFLAILKNLDNMEAGFYNYEIGTNQPVSIKEFVDLVKKIAGNNQTELNFGALAYRENEIMLSDVNTSQIRKLGWQVKHALEDGLRQTIKAEQEKK